MVRAFSRETTLSPENFIYPLFIHRGSDKEPIPSMPGCFRLDPNSLLKEAESALEDGIRSIVLFPKVPDDLKSKDGHQAYNSEGLVQESLRALKKRFPELLLVTDVALDPYSSDGHDGIVARDGRILNDETVDILVKQAVSQAEAGADVIAPSDMMDGRVGAIREGLDEKGFTDVSILSYCAKYASAFYGPFRDALDSAPEERGQKDLSNGPREPGGSYSRSGARRVRGCRLFDGQARRSIP